MTSMPGGVLTHHGNLHCYLPGGVRAHHGLFRARTFETPATFHIPAKKPLDSAVVHSRKSKDQSFAFVDKHCCHPVYITYISLKRL